MKLFVQNYLQNHIDLINRLIDDEKLVKKIIDCSNYIITSLKSDKKILFAGNGGSAAEAQHMAAELVGRFNFNREGLKAISLSCDTSILTSVSNDFGFDKIFSRQIETLGDEGDILVVYSTSGKSENILKAIDEAKNKKMFVIGFSGNNGFANNNCDIDLIISSKQTSLIQEMHNIIGHIIFSIVENKIFKS